MSAHRTPLAHRFATRVGLVVACAVAVSPLMPVATAQPSQATLVRLTDRGINSHGAFWHDLWPKRVASPQSWLDWSTDLCGDAPAAPSGVSFARACRRRDFGVANACGLGIMTSARRQRIDRQFRRDLNRACPAVRLVCPAAIDEAVRFATRVPLCA
jgi:Prokaryotic phospholipase A2